MSAYVVVVYEHEDLHKAASDAVDFADRQTTPASYVWAGNEANVSDALAAAKVEADREGPVVLYWRMEAGAA